MPLHSILTGGRSCSKAGCFVSFLVEPILFLLAYLTKDVGHLMTSSQVPGPEDRLRALQRDKDKTRSSVVAQV